MSNKSFWSRSDVGSLPWAMFLYMISTLRLEQIEQIDPWPQNWQGHFNSSSVKRTVRVCCNVAAGKFPHCKTVSDCRHGHRTLEDSCHCEWQSVQRRIDWWGGEQQHNNRNSTPKTFLLRMCARVSKCISVCLPTLNWEKLRSTNYVWSQGERKQERLRRMNEGDRNSRQATWVNQQARWCGNLHLRRARPRDWFVFAIVCLLGLISWQNKRRREALFSWLPTRDSQGTAWVENHSCGSKKSKHGLCNENISVSIHQMIFKVDEYLLGYLANVPADKSEGKQTY